MNDLSRQAQTASSRKNWQKTQYANLIRHVSSGTYYARLRVRGKLIWRSLQTDVLSVAKLRLSDFEKQERQRSESAAAVGAGRMTFAETIALHRQRVAGDQSLKPQAREYHGQRIAAVLKSWPRSLSDLETAGFLHFV